MERGYRSWYHIRNETRPRGQTSRRQLRFSGLLDKLIPTFRTVHIEPVLFCFFCCFFFSITFMKINKCKCMPQPWITAFVWAASPQTFSWHPVVLKFLLKERQWQTMMTVGECVCVCVCVCVYVCVCDATAFTHPPGRGTWCWYVLFEWDAINVTYKGRICLCSLVGPPAAAFGRRRLREWQSGEMVPFPCVN